MPTETQGLHESVPKGFSRLLVERKAKIALMPVSSLVFGATSFVSNGPDWGQIALWALAGMGAFAAIGAIILLAWTPRSQRDDARSERDELREAALTEASWLFDADVATQAVRDLRRRRQRILGEIEQLEAAIRAEVTSGVNQQPIKHFRDAKKLWNEYAETKDGVRLGASITSICEHQGHATCLDVAHPFMLDFLIDHLETEHLTLAQRNALT